MTLLFFVMPSQRKRIGFLPSQEVHEIIDKLCRDNEFSQSKVTGLLVEEALKSRGVLNNSFPPNGSDKSEFINSDFEKVSFFKKNKSTNISDDYTVSKKELSENIKLMHEFLEYKYFKKIMKQNKKIFE